MPVFYCRHFIQRVERLHLVDDHVAGAFAPRQPPLDDDERRPESVFVFLVGRAEYHAGYVPELILQCDKGHLAAGALPADNQPGGGDKSAVA